MLSVVVAVVLGTPAFESNLQAQESGKRVAGKGGRKAGAQKRTKKAKRTSAKDKDRNAPVRAASRDKSTEAQPAAAPAPEPAGADSHTARAPSEDAAALASDADERVRKEGGEEVKTVEFGGLDIEGQLKTPQMLYFLNRLRAEFSRPELPHRSFIPELQRGTEENGF
jgi:hypothetical protein